MRFRKVPLTNPETKRLQDECEATFRQIEQNEFMSGVFVRSVSLAGGSADTIVDHGLGRRFIGWLLSRKSANADVWDSGTTNNLPDRQLILKASAACVVTLYVF